MKRVLALLVFCALVLAGCRSHVIAVTITNNGSDAIRNIEVQYPGGSYGINRLEPGRSHTYRIKPFSAATMQISYEDAAGKQQVKSGPRVEKGQEGALSVSIKGRDLTYTITGP
jgi:hypothetical protein